MSILHLVGMEIQKILVLLNHIDKRQPIHSKINSLINTSNSLSSY